jgi:aminoglycoside phosphotransferase
VTDDAVLAKARHHRVLSGLSEAIVYLLTEDGSNWFVRKVAIEPESSPRLRRQVAKQSAFAELATERVRTPAILGEGVVDDRYYFDMEFIQGTDGASFLRQAAIPDVHRFTELLCEHLELAASLETDERIDPFAVLAQRVDDAERRTGALGDDRLDRLHTMLESAREIGPVRATQCHGDLTLENMVIDRGGDIWLIDLLDSPIEHYWQDVAKLHQDLAGGWYLRRVGPISRSVLWYVSRAVLEGTIARHPDYRRVHDTLLACTFVRILPYATGESDRRLILERIDYFATPHADPERRP